MLSGRLTCRGDPPSLRPRQIFHGVVVGRDVYAVPYVRRLRQINRGHTLFSRTSITAKRSAWESHRSNDSFGPWEASSKRMRSGRESPSPNTLPRGPRGLFVVKKKQIVPIFTLTKKAHYWM